MKQILIITALLSIFQLSAQTKIIKRNAVKANDYGVTYSLPKTAINFDVEFTRTTYKAGPYYQYAEKYLGITQAITKDDVLCKIESVTLRNKGVVDKDQTYTVSFKPGTTAPYVTLTKEGLICTINAPYSFSQETETEEEKLKKKGITIKPQMVLSEELLMAGSTAKQAEVAAKMIYRIRESRLNILTGEADNLPPDGAAMKIVIEQLEAQEKTLTSLFIGTTAVEHFYYTTPEIYPNEAIQNQVLFRFSNKLGIVDADDLSGSPVYFSLSVLEKAPKLSEKELEKKNKKLSKGLVYNLPGKALISIEMNKKIILEKEILVTQFGTQEALAEKVFEDNKHPVKILFYPESGAIKQIIQ